MTRPRRRWTDRDYDLVEALTALGLPASDVGRLLDPPATARQCYDMARHAGIPFTNKLGKPSSDDRARYNRIVADWLHPAAADARDHAELQEHADRLGLEITIHGRRRRAR